MEEFKKAKIVVKMPDAEKGEMPIPVLQYPFGVPTETPNTEFEFYSDKQQKNFGAIRKEEGEDGVKYVGMTSTAEENSFRYVIGFYDEEKGELIIKPILGNAPIQMDVMVPGHDYNEPEIDAEHMLVEPNEPINDALHDTYNLFGTRRVISSLKSREELSAIKSNVKITDHLSKKLEDISKQAEEDKFTTEQVLLHADENRNLPPYHLNATTGEEAYVFDELFPERFWPLLKLENWIQDQNTSIIDKIEFLSQYSDFAAKMMSKVSVSDDITEVKIGFIACLINLYKMKKTYLHGNQNEITKIEKLSKIDSRIIEHYYNDFYTKKQLESNKYWIMSTKSQKSLLISYIVIMALLINDCSVDSSHLEILRKELVLDQDQFLKSFEIVGATVTKEYSSSNLNSYKVQLLISDSKRPKIKTLHDCLPNLTMIRRSRKR